VTVASAQFQAKVDESEKERMVELVEVEDRSSALRILGATAESAPTARLAPFQVHCFMASEPRPTLARGGVAAAAVAAALRQSPKAVAAGEAAVARAKAHSQERPESPVETPLESFG
jgi:hypothetical protein